MIARLVALARRGVGPTLGVAVSTSWMLSMVLGVSPRSAALGAVLVGVAARGAAVAIDRLGLVPHGDRIAFDVLGWAAAPVIVGVGAWCGSHLGGAVAPWAGLSVLLALAVVPRRGPETPRAPGDPSGAWHLLAWVSAVAQLLVVPWFQDVGALVVMAAAVGIAVLADSPRLASIHPAWHRSVAVSSLALLLGRVLVAQWDGVDLGALRSPLLSNDVFFDEAEALAIAGRGTSVDPFASGGAIGYHRLPHAWAGVLHRVLGMGPFESTAGVAVAVCVAGIALMLVVGPRVVGPRVVGPRDHRLGPPRVALLLVAVAAAAPVEPVWLVEFPKIGNVLGLMLLAALLLFEADRGGTGVGRTTALSALLVAGLVGTKLQFAVVAGVAVVAHAVVARRARRHVAALGAAVTAAAVASFAAWFLSIDRLLTWSEGDASTRVNLSLAAIARQVGEGAMLPVVWRVVPALILCAATRPLVPLARIGVVGALVALPLASLAGEPSKFASAALLAAALTVVAASPVTVRPPTPTSRRGKRLWLLPLVAAGVVAALGYEMVKWSFPADGFRRYAYAAARSEVVLVGLLLLVSIGVAARRLATSPTGRPRAAAALAVVAACAMIAQAGTFVAKAARTYVTEWRYPGVAGGGELRPGLTRLAAHVRRGVPDEEVLGTNTFCHALRRDDGCIGAGSSAQIAALTERRMYLEAPILRSTSEDLDVRGRAGTSLRFALFADPLAAGELRAAGVSHFVVDMTRTDRTSWEPVGRTVMISGDFALVELRDPRG